MQTACLQFKTQKETLRATQPPHLVDANPLGDFDALFEVPAALAPGLHLELVKVLGLRLSRMFFFLWICDRV